MAIVLANTDESLEIYQAESPTVDPSFICTFTDYTTTGKPDRQVGTLTDGGDTTIVSAPGASTQRVIETVCINNLDAAAITLTPMFDEAGTEYPFGTFTVNPGEQLIYTQGKWQVATGTSSVKVSYQDAAPASPTADDLWYETDTNIWWFWNGTYWLSCNMFEVRKNFTGVTGITNLSIMPQNDQAVAYDFFLVDLGMVTYVATTNDGSNYWTVSLQRTDASEGTLVTLGSMTTASDAINTWVQEKLALDTFLDTSALGGDLTTLRFRAALTSTPGALTADVVLTYRWAHL